MAKEKNIKQLKLEGEAAETAALEIFNAKNPPAPALPDNSEREALIAEANRLTGRVEAFDFTSKTANVLAVLQLKKIKESKVYKEIKGCGTWENYCKSIGFSRAKIDEDIVNLEILGEQFLLTVGTFGMGYRDLKQLKSASKTGKIEILDDAISIDGEVISLTETDRLKDALEAIVEAKDELISEKDRVITAKEELNKKLSEQREEARRESKEAKQKINNFISGKDYAIDDDELDDFRELKSIEDRLTGIFFDLNRLANSTLSERNQHLFGGCILHGFKLLDDLRMKVANAGVYIDRLYMEDREIEASDRMLLPSDFKRRKQD